MDRLVLRLGLASLVALASLPAIAGAQAAPAAAPQPAPAAAPAAPEPAPAAAPAMMAEPAAAPAGDAATMHAEHEARHEGEAGSAEAATPAVAAAAPAPKLTGYIEAGYQANFSDMRVKDAVPLNLYNPNGHSFVLHSAHFNIDHKFSDSLSAHIGIDAGRDATINGARPYGGGPFDVLEAFATYTGGKVSLTAGKFVTYEGIEVAPGPLNPTVTRGYLYYFAEPITHTGFKVHYQATDELNIGLGIVNGWDNLVDDNNMKTFIGRIGYTPSTSFFAALSATYGAEALHNDKNQRLSLDLTGCWTVTDSVLLNFQGNFGTEPNAGFKNQSSTAIDSSASWYGVGIQPVYTSGAWSLGGRVEWFADPNGARVAAAATGVKGNYVNVALAPGYKLADGFRIRAELRADISTEKTIPLVARGAGTTMFTGALMADYQF